MEEDELENETQIVPIIVINGESQHIISNSKHGLTESETEESSGLNTLLNEEIVNAFSFLPSEERQKLRGVCRSWRDIIDTSFGIKIRVKNSTKDLIIFCPNAYEVELNSMTQPFETGISFAHTIRKLIFSNIVVTYNLVSFLRACSNISHLAFANTILDQPFNDPWSQLARDNTQISLLNLNTIEIRCFTFTEGVLEILNFLNEVVTFTKLKDFIINVQNPPVIPYQLLFERNINLDTTHPLIKLLNKLRPTMTKFQIGRLNLPTVFKFYPVDETETSFPPKLEQLEIHPYFREEWGPILREQTSIRILNLGSCNVSRWPEIQESIIMNSLALECFTIGGLSFGQIWDCSVFQNCLKLRNVSIEISHSNKINLAMLPLQLKSLHVFGPVPRYEIVAVSEVLRGLEELKFTHLGRIAEFNNAEEDKVTLNVFKALLQLPNLKSLSFVTCSTISIDWDIISLWCASVDGTPGFTFRETYYQTHGELFRNGIDITLADDFKRENFDWTLVPLIMEMETPSVVSTSLGSDTTLLPET